MKEKTHSGSALYRAMDRFLGCFEVGAAAVGAVAIIVAMVLTSLDALLRYTINKPIAINFFLTENYLMVALICLPLSWAFRTGGYIRISFLYQSLPRPAANILLRAGFLASFLLIADLAWLSWLEFLKSLHENEIIMDVLDWPMYLSWIWVPIGLGLLAVRLLLTTFGPAQLLVQGLNPEEEGV